MKCVSLYTGCGGLDLGFHDVGFRTVWANDIDAHALKSFRMELTRRELPVPDLHHGDLSEMTLPERGCADLVIGGPPCQGFSVAGKMDPADPRSRHVWEFFKVVQHISPSAFVMENVKALAQNSRWRGTLQALQRRGAELGFSTRLFVLNSARFGVPQARERMFLVGVKRGSVAAPKPVGEVKTIREALRSLPAVGEPGNDSICSARVTAAKSPVLRKSPYAGMLFNGQGRPMDLDKPAPTLPASMGGNRTPIIDQKCLEEEVEPWVVSYHSRLVRGGVPLTRIPKRLRRLTVEEAACLQGFPLGMQFEGSQCAKFRQIGNSVPPALGAAVAKTVMAALEGDSGRYEWEGCQKMMICDTEKTYHAVSA